MKRPLRVALQVAFVGAIYGVLIWVLAGTWNDLARRDFALRWDVFAWSAGVLAVGFLMTIGLWYVLTRRLGCALPVRETAAAYAASQLGKYVPGKVWMFVARFYFYRRAGIARGRIVLAMVLEAFYTLAGPSTVLLVSSLFARLPIPPALRWLAAGLLAFGLVAIHPRIAERAINLALRLAKREPIRIELRYRELVGLLVAYGAANAVFGLSVYLLVASVHPLPLSRVADVCLATSVTGLVAMLAVFAPAGAGVREAGFYGTLRLFVPDPIAIVVALLSRVWSTAVELILVAAILLVTRAPRLSQIRREAAEIEEL